MKATRRPDHRALATALRTRVLEGPAETTPELRRAASERAAGGASLDAPYDDLARQIGEAAYRVTDEQVASVLEAVGTEKAAFELIAASALGAGLVRWERAIQALEEASDAPA